MSYLGDMLGAALTSCMRSGLNTFSTPTAQPLKILGQVIHDLCLKLQDMAHKGGAHPADVRMIRWMSGAPLADRLSSEELRRRVGV